MRKARLLTGLLLCGMLVLPNASVTAAPERIDTHAEAAALIDVKSGRLLHSEQGDKRMRIASLTKIMTAIVAIEHGRLSDQVKVNQNAFGKEGSSIYLRLGEEMSLHNLLYGMMLRSGNDAATAIAEHVGGSMEGFVYLMNEKAKQLGMTGTQFRNPHGLDDDGHYSTANDMAKLAAYALKNPVFQDIVKTKVKAAPNPNEPWDYKWTNKNRMLTIYEGADGVKTGYTKLARRCLVSSATRGGQQLAVVTLNDPDDWADHSRLLDYGFQNFPLAEVVKKGDRLEGQPIVAGQSFFYPIHRDEQTSLRKEAVLADKASIGYRFGERGTLKFYLNGQMVGSVPLYAENAPQLKAQTNSAFRYQESTLGEEGGWQRLGSAFKTVFRRLLAPGF